MFIRNCFNILGEAENGVFNLKQLLRLKMLVKAEAGRQGRALTFHPLNQVCATPLVGKKSCIR
jgi:hypothetical protein